MIEPTLPLNWSDLVVGGGWILGESADHVVWKSGRTKTMGNGAAPAVLPDTVSKTPKENINAVSAPVTFLEGFLSKVVRLSVI